MISIHAPGVGCDAVPRELRSHHEISIHAPRVGCDVKELIGEGKSVISIHAPRVGCDLMRELESYADKEFQSTHPVWGATRTRSCRYGCSWHFNPRTPCGVRRKWIKTPDASSKISIHAPRVGCDLANW